MTRVLQDRERDRDRPSGRNRRLALVLAGVFAGMLGLSFASVPLYRLFCQVTGFGGTTQVAAAAPHATDEDGTIRVRFNADIVPGLAWRFRPEQVEMTVRVGARSLAFYRATSRAAGPTVGTATFNVTPLKAGKYFSKIECFCFTEQALAAGERARMPVDFFVDPAIRDDPDTADVTAITLSYTFFPKPAGQAGPDGADGGDRATRLAAASNAGPAPLDWPRPAVR